MLDLSVQISVHCHVSQTNQTEIQAVSLGVRKDHIQSIEYLQMSERIESKKAY